MPELATGAASRRWSHHFADPLNARLLPRNGITSPFLLAS